MKRISYQVNCENKSLNIKIKEDKKYLEKLLAEIIYKRKEKICYENASSKRININQMQRSN